MLIICFPNADKDIHRDRTDWSKFGISFFTLDENNIRQPVPWDALIFPESYQLFFKTILKKRYNDPTHRLFPSPASTFEYYEISRYEYETILLLSDYADRIPVNIAIQDFYNPNFIIAATTIFWSLCPTST